MVRFSDRIGITKPPTEIQVNSINEALYNSLWNLIVTVFNSRWKYLLENLYIGYYKESLEYLPRFESDCRDQMRKRFAFSLASKSHWYEACNLIEHLLQNIEHLTGENISQGKFEEILNIILERELSGKVVSVKM